MGAPLTVRLLGKVEAWRGERLLRLGGRRQCCVVAVLALQAGYVVAVADLVDAVWGDRPPATARQQLHSAVSSLRRTLGGAIVTSQAGYELAVEPQHVDALAFEAQAVQARQLAAEGELAGAVDLWNQALGLWSGPALGGIASLSALGVGLEERRLSVVEERIEAELRLGRHDDLVAELSVLAATHPVRERITGQLMTALYRSGRAADALEVYRRSEQLLGTELGLDPGPALRQLNLAVLRGDVAVEVEPEASAPLRPTTPAQLPPDVPGFVGRRAALSTLDRIVAREDRATAPSTVVITGSAGVGKTALAVHWAHLTAGRFPDGQLFVNLSGCDPQRQPLDPVEVLHGFLTALADAPDRLPSEPAAAAGLFRSLVADRALLIVLDDARDAEQVRPLLPGTPHCQVLITSRDQLPGLVSEHAADLLRLDVLTAAEARELLAFRLGDDRAAAEPQAVRDIVAACARLPLALANAAARAAAHPAFPVTAIAGELQPEHVRLEALSTGDLTTSLRAAFAESYGHLRPSAAQLFGLLSLNPDPEISIDAAASLAGVPVEEARPLLSELDRVNLVIEHAPGRFRHHDLLRLFAAEQAGLQDPENRRGAADRLAAYQARRAPYHQ